jgi:ion channel-forming bestrophin family protein
MKIPSLSIVVGLMLVFRNQTSYNRFWDGRNNFTVLLTSVRNLTRSFLCCSHRQDVPLTPAEKADIERTVRILIAILYAVKNYLRAEWGAAWEPISRKDVNGNTDAMTPRFNPEYSDILPTGLKGHEDEGLGFPLQLTTFIESFIKRGVDRGWFNAPQASQLTVQINTMVDAYGKMETIRITPVPIAYLIHQKQVLALFGCVLPFAMVEDMGWWSVPYVTLVIFTLYGIEGIGSQLEDPFGYDRNDINMDAIVEDGRTEVNVMLDEWLRVSSGDTASGEMFVEDRRPFISGMS